MYQNIIIYDHNTYWVTTYAPAVTDTSGGSVNDHPLEFMAHVMRFITRSHLSEAVDPFQDGLIPAEVNVGRGDEFNHQIDEIRIVTRNVINWIK